LQKSSQTTENAKHLPEIAKYIAKSLTDKVCKNDIAKTIKQALCTHQTISRQNQGVKFTCQCLSQEERT